LLPPHFPKSTKVWRNVNTAGTKMFQCDKPFLGFNVHSTYIYIRSLRTWPFNSFKWIKNVYDNYLGNALKILKNFYRNFMTLFSFKLQILQWNSICIITYLKKKESTNGNKKFSWVLRTLTYEFVGKSGVAWGLHFPNPSSGHFMKLKSVL